MYVFHCARNLYGFIIALDASRTSGRCWVLRTHSVFCGISIGMPFHEFNIAMDHDDEYETFIIIHWTGFGSSRLPISILLSFYWLIAHSDTHSKVMERMLLCTYSWINDRGSVIKQYLVNVHVFPVPNPEHINKSNVTQINRFESIRKWSELSKRRTFCIAIVFRHFNCIRDAHKARPM